MGHCIQISKEGKTDVWYTRDMSDGLFDMKIVKVRKAENTIVEKA